MSKSLRNTHKMVLFLVIQIVMVICVTFHGSHAAECDLSLTAIKDCEAIIKTMWKINEDTRLENVDVKCRSTKYECISVKSGVQLTITGGSFEGPQVENNKKIYSKIFCFLGEKLEILE